MEKIKMSWAKEAIQDIKKTQLKHRNWERAISKGCASLFASSPGEVVSIVGPSRAGKSCLIEELSSMLAGVEEHRIEDQLPVIDLLATNQSRGTHFETKDFFIHALERAGHPIYGVNAPGDTEGFERNQLLKRTSEATLVRALVHNLKARQCMYVFIDESQHVLHIVGKEAAAARFFDSMKALAQEGDFILVLVGTYPLLNALGLASHLIGRNVKVILDRYRSTDEELQAFEQILDSYTKLVRLPAGVKSLRDWNSLLHPGSLGCIGHLNSWLRHALSEVIVEGGETLEKKHLLKTIKNEKELGSLSEEILIGEQELCLGLPEKVIKTGVNSSKRKKIKI